MPARPQQGAALSFRRSYPAAIRRLRPSTQFRRAGTALTTLTGKSFIHQGDFDAAVGFSAGFGGVGCGRFGGAFAGYEYAVGLPNA